VVERQSDHKIKTIKEQMVEKDIYQIILLLYVINKKKTNSPDIAMVWTLDKTQTTLIQDLCLILSK